MKDRSAMERCRKDDPYGGLLDVTDEDIQRIIEEYSYVMDRLKDCRDANCI